MCKGKSRGPVRDLKYMPHVPTQVGNPGKHLVALLRSMANRGSPEALRGVQGPQVTHPPSSPFQLFYLDWCPGCQSACQPLHIIRLPPPQPDSRTFVFKSCPPPPPNFSSHEHTWTVSAKGRAKTHHDLLLLYIAGFLLRSV